MWVRRVEMLLSFVSFKLTVWMTAKMSSGSLKIGCDLQDVVRTFDLTTH